MSSGLKTAQQLNFQSTLHQHSNSSCTPINNSSIQLFVPSSHSAFSFSTSMLFCIHHFASEFQAHSASLLNAVRSCSNIRNASALGIRCTFPHSNSALNRPTIASNPDSLKESRNIRISLPMEILPSVFSSIGTRSNSLPVFSNGCINELGECTLMVGIPFGLALPMLKTCSSLGHSMEN